MVSGSCALPPRWPPQCSCVVIESSFDPGERLQAPGSLWSLNVCKIKEIHINIHFGWEEWCMGRLIWRRQDRDSFLVQVGIKLIFSEFILIIDLVFGFYCSEQK